jgi:hypothetical protein
MSAAPEQKTSGLAVAALTVAILASLALVGGFAMAFHAATAHVPDTSTLASIGMMLFAGGVLDLAALVLAIVALRNRNTSHRVAIIAAVLAAVGLVITLLVLILGLMKRH